MRYSLIIPLAICLFVLSALTSGCSCSKSSDETDITITDSGSADFEFTEAREMEFEDFQDEYSTIDTDGDGQDDKTIMRFERQELADDLYLDRTIEYETTDEGQMGTIILEFDGDASGYNHMEIIPKSFAYSVKDLEFSVEPTAVLEDDPIVVWEDGALKGIETIKIKAKKAILENENVQQQFGEALWNVGSSAFNQMKNYYSGKKVDTSKITQSTKSNEEKIKDAVAESLFIVGVEHFDDFQFIYQLKKLTSQKYTDDLALLHLIMKFPDRFDVSICDLMNDYHPFVYGNALASCYAITTRDMSYCDMKNMQVIEKYASATEREYYTESIHDKMVDICKHTAFDAFKNLCKDMSRNEKDRCIMQAALDANFSYGCRQIADEVIRKECEDKFKNKDAAKLGKISINFEPDDEPKVTGLRYNVTILAEDPPGAVKYELDWGEGEKPITVYNGMTTRMFTAPGEYSLTATITDLASEEILGQTEQEIKVTYPYTKLEMIQRTKHLSVIVCANATEVWSSGKSYDRRRMCTMVYHINASLDWQDNKFSIHWENTIDKNWFKVDVEGMVNDEVDTILSIDAKIQERNYKDENRVQHIVLTSVPINSSRPYPIRLEPDYEPRFRSYQYGNQVGQYVTTTEYKATKPTTQDPDQSYYLKAYDYGDPQFKPYVLVVFACDRVTANDDPGYPNRDG